MPFQFNFSRYLEFKIHFHFIHTLANSQAEIIFNPITLRRLANDNKNNYGRNKRENNKINSQRDYDDYNDYYINNDSIII